MSGDTSRYHHGDLRRTLIEAADDLLREIGIDKLTLRGIARRAGVSHGAPYHHFADLNRLLAAVAAEGFARLRTEMLKAARSSDSDPLNRLQEAGIAYVSFAARNPELYRLMFSGRLNDVRDDSDLSSSAGAAFEALGELLHEASPATSGSTSSGAAEGVIVVAQATWAMVHGLAMLLIDGRLDVATADLESVQQLARRVTRTLGRGLRAG